MTMPKITITAEDIASYNTAKRSGRGGGKRRKHGLTREEQEARALTKAEQIIAKYIANGMIRGKGLQRVCKVCETVVDLRKLKDEGKSVLYCPDCNALLAPVSTANVERKINLAKESETSDFAKILDK